MSIHGPVNVPLQPNWSPSPSHANTTLSNKENLLPKTILEGNKSSSSPLTTKKVEKEEAETMLERTNDYISSFFRVKRTQKNLESIKTQISETLTKLDEKPSDLKVEMNLRFRLVEYVLKRSLFCSDSGRQTCLEDARNQINYMNKVAYFSCFTQMATYLLKVFDGINCLDMNAIRVTILNLRRADILASNGSKELTTLVAFFETRWTELKGEGQIDEKTFNLLNQNLKHIMSEDPFRDEFIKNPELFKKVKDAPPALLEKYPHLTSPGRFIERYPRAGWIELPNQTFNTENLKLCINKAKTSPLATTLLLPSVEPIITPSHALLIKDLLVEKQSLGIVFGNEDDLTTLTDAFIKDNNLILDKKSLLGDLKHLDSFGKVFFFGINPDYPVKKKVQPHLEAKKPESSLQSKPVQSKPTDSVSAPLQAKPTLLEGHVFFTLTRLSGKKALIVRDYEVEAVMQIKNRTYVDENGITQQFDIIALGPEDYEKLDIIEGKIKEKYSSDIEDMLIKHKYSSNIESGQSSSSKSNQIGSISGALQDTTALVEGQIFIILNMASGKKALAVKDYEVEAVKKLDRKYIDKNRVTQEYEIVVFGPEYYDKLDMAIGSIKEKNYSNLDSMLHVQEALIKSQSSSSTPLEFVLAPLQGNSTREPILVLTEQDGKKVLSVKEHQLEAVLKLNRLYIDKNNRVQEYGIVIIDRELYETTDKIIEPIRRELVRQKTTLK